MRSTLPSVFSTVQALALSETEHYTFADVSLLTLSTLGKIFSRQHFEIFFLVFPANKTFHANGLKWRQFANGDNLHEYQILCSGKTRKISLIFRLLN